MQQAGERVRARIQSGLSKQWDFSVTQEILRAYGDTVKDSIRNVLERDRGGAAGRSDRGCHGPG